MCKWLHKLLLSALIFSFFISATEMNVGEARNTFFDEYDTFVKTEEVTLDLAISAQKEHDTNGLIYFIIKHYKKIKGHPETVKHPNFSYYSHYPPKLFLQHSVWRI